MHIRDVMTFNPRTVTLDDTIQNAAQIMRDEDTGVVPVVDNGRPIGMVTDRDIVVRAVADGQPNRPIREIVTSAVVTATPSSPCRAIKPCRPPSAKQPSQPEQSTVAPCNWRMERWIISMVSVYSIL